MESNDRGLEYFSKRDHVIVFHRGVGVVSPISIGLQTSKNIVDVK